MIKLFSDREERGEDSYTLPEEAYPIPFDDSTPLGNWGYLSCFEEIRTQVNVIKIHQIYVSLGY